ncbi:hypothetical protein QFZ52_001046 [Arthrobacter woluwensis]|uniref:hypothetical protein n=1 Tax=Arthrobacter woluwensis TaxID=156980 RepID=UPI00278496A2|nr:hypothetical protein [Arthrobacter woluwensis]MDQ0708394.1 hypothetical protein [Arthrobacter woluwensis]
MEPIAATAAAIGLINAGVTPTKTTTSAVAKTVQRLRLAGTYDPQWLVLDPSLSGGLTSSEISDLSSFLRSDEMKPVLAFSAISIMYDRQINQPEMIATAKELIRNQIRAWRVTPRPSGLEVQI